MKSYEEVRDRVASHIKSVHDFPKPGINFRDIMPIFAHPDVVSDMCLAIAEHVKAKFGQIDVVAGLEARGFLFGPQVAVHLGCRFLPIRKKGKLPGVVIQASYVKEYGEDIVEIQADALRKGDKVLLVDDLLATGGTMQAGVRVLESAGATVIGSYVLIELASLNGRKANPNVQIETLISYPEE